MEFKSIKPLTNDEASRTHTLLNNGLFEGVIEFIRQRVKGGIHIIELPDTKKSGFFAVALKASGLFKQTPTTEGNQAQ